METSGGQGERDYCHVTHRLWYMYTDLVRLVADLLIDVFSLDLYFSFSFNKATDSNCLFSCIVTTTKSSIGSFSCSNYCSVVV